MAKKLKIDFNYDEDIVIIGISCHKIDYWIAHQLNGTLKIKLTREPDLPVYNPETDESIGYPLFYFLKNDTDTAFSLISNHHPDGKLFPDQKSFDYLLMISGLLSEDERQMLIAQIKKIQHVLTAHNLNLKKIKNLHEFISDLEIHLTKINEKGKSKL